MPVGKVTDGTLRVADGNEDVGTVVGVCVLKMETVNVSEDEMTE